MKILIMRLLEQEFFKGPPDAMPIKSRTRQLRVIGFFVQRVLYHDLNTHFNENTNRRVQNGSRLSRSRPRSMRRNKTNELVYMVHKTPGVHGVSYVSRGIQRIQKILPDAVPNGDQGFGIFSVEGIYPLAGLDGGYPRVVVVVLIDD